MKFIKDEVLNILSQQYGNEPIMIVAVTWNIQFQVSNYNNSTNLTDDQLDTVLQYGLNNSSTFSFFADKDIYDDKGNILIPGKILSISEISSAVDFSSNASSSQVTIVIDDTDNNILETLKSANIHKRPASVYIYYEGMQLADMIPVFEGEIVSDFRWSEKDKTVTFNFLSHIEEREVGYSPEQGYIQDLPLEMIGRSWPFGFGDIVKYPCIRINYTPTAVLIDPFGIHDYSLDSELQRLDEIKKSYKGLIELYAKAALEAYFSGLNDIGDQMTNLLNEVITQMNQVNTDTDNLAQILQEQILYEHGLNANDGRPAFVDVLTDVPVKLTGLFQIGEIVVSGSLLPGDQRTGKLKVEKITHPIPGQPSWGSNYFPPQKQDFVFVNAGTTVKFLGRYPLRYLVNTLGGSVQGVFAYRQFEGLRRLAPVPHKYYTVISVRTVPPGVVTTYPNFHALVVELTQPLSTLKDQGWDDELYVSYKSSVGPKLRDIIKFLITYYTHYRIDSKSLAKIPNLNCSFVLPDQKDVMSVLKEICFQCNIAIWTSDNTFFFLYLPQFYFSRMYVKLDDIIKDSVEISISPTEDIITKMRGSWRYNYEYDTRNYVAIRYHDDIFGVHGLDIDYYCFSDPDSVIRSIEFWLYRKGNVWKRIKLTLPIRFIQLDIYDNLALSKEVVDKYLLGDIKVGETLDCSIIGMKLNPENSTVDLELEAPVYVGGKKTSPAYWLGSAGGLMLWQIDDNYQLTETPKQYRFYQRGFSISKTLNGAQLQSEYFKALTSKSSGSFNGLPSPNSINGDPTPSGITPWTKTDVGGPSGIYSAPRVDFPQQGKQFSLVNQPKWDYNYGQYPINPVDNKDQGNCFPGIANEFVKGKTYKCTVYVNGMNKSGRNIVAECIQISTDKTADRIPKGTGALFSKTTTGSQDEVIENYWFIVPIWMG
jgi:hypothetical protein